VSFVEACQGEWLRCLLRLVEVRGGRESQVHTCGARIPRRREALALHPAGNQPRRFHDTDAIRHPTP